MNYSKRDEIQTGLPFALSCRKINYTYSIFDFYSATNKSVPWVVISD